MLYKKILNQTQEEEEWIEWTKGVITLLQELPGNILADTEMMWEEVGLPWEEVLIR